MISGFLITGILLDSRSAVEREETSAKRALHAFYVRRFLRIFPLYYAVLVLLFLGSERGSPCVSLARDVPVELVLRKDRCVRRFGCTPLVAGGGGAVLPVWPWFVLLLPKSTLPWTITGMIATGPVSRMLFGYAGATDLALWIATPTALDALGLGCFLAWFSRKSKSVNRVARWALIAGLVLLGAHHGMDKAGVPGYVVFSLKPLAWALVWMWLVNCIAVGKGGPVLRLLRSRVLIYIGTISYGIYLFHLPVIHALGTLQSRLGMGNLRHHSVLHFVIMSLITILLAALSWRYFERPINSLKNRFPYT